MACVLGFRAAGGPGSIEGVVTYGRQQRGHDDSLIPPPADLPPVGGVHHSLIQNCGIYLTPIETGKAVHSMEHGAVWITFQPEITARDVDLLQQKVRGQQYLLLSPYSGLQSPIVISAWGNQLAVDSVHDPRIEQFIDRFRLGPATPERGASCTGGYGTPLP